MDRSIANPEIFVQTNVMGTVNLLQRAKEAWYDPDARTWKPGKKYLQVSTDEVYGALGAEGYFTETTPLCPHSPYSSSKASADLFVMAFHDTYGMPVNITRCSNNYGPYQFPEKLIPLMIHNVKNHKQLPVYGDGMQIRDWLYVEDHCKAIDMVAEGGKVGEVYNVGGHNERPNIFIVKTIIAQLHDRLQDEGISEALIRHVTDRLGHDRRYGIDPTKIKNDLGWYRPTRTGWTTSPAAATRSITKRCTKTSEPASPPDPGRGFLRGGQRLQRNHDFSIHNEKNEMPAKEAFRCFRGFRCFRDSVEIVAAAPSASSGRSSEGAAGAALRFSQAGTAPRRENRLSARVGMSRPALPPCALPSVAPLGQRAREGVSTPPP